MQNYWSWLKKLPARLEHLPEASFDVPELVETTTAKICLESGTIMLRCKVGHGFPFTIDRSMTGGVWFDQGEWEALQERQFHDEIHLVFTAPWQDAVRHAHVDAAYQALLVEHFGEDLLSELASLKERLTEHPHREFALAFLHSQ
ncbi:MAG: hypothetical protein ABGY95_06520 [Rubritalea sp.]|uniref:hypothetical protein n=1 Tax=Rubritalea sp. TaxID=2109375 RepID=UPI003241C39B